MSTKLKHIIFNICLLLNGMLFFLLLFGSSYNLPVWLQVFGRMHPLLLHFPIVLLIVAAVWELFAIKHDHLIIKAAGDWLLIIAAATSVLTASFGLFLSNEEGYDANALQFHKWAGIATALLSSLWYGYRLFFRRKSLYTLIMGVVCIVAVLLAGHKGADITHGENFLLAPIAPKANTPDVLFEDALSYTHVVKPILDAKCMSCHNDQKAKGQLVMTTEELILLGGKNGKLWDSTASDFGLMMQRIHLPIQEKKHMPPVGKPQLTDEEAFAIYYWIKNGASFTQKVIDLPETDTLRIIAANLFKTIETDNYDFAPAKESTIKKLNTDYRVVQPIAIQAPALSVEFFGASFFQSKQIKELEPLKKNIVSLNLSKMAVIDDDLKHIAVFNNLRKLNLSFTKISGSTLSELKQLKELRQLSLSGNIINPTALESLKGLEKLATIYLWNTGMSEPQLARLKTIFKHVDIQTGFNGDNIIAKLSKPIIEGGSQAFTGTTSVGLKSFINGVEIYYTLDGTEPDSLISSLYKNEIVIDKSGVLQAKAFLKGWISSDVVQKKFNKAGYKIDSVFLDTKPAPEYTASGAKTLSDGVQGELDFKTKWLGFRENDMVAFIYLNKPDTLKNVTLSCLVDINSYIMPAEQIQIWGGTNNSNLKLLKTIYPKLPNKLAAPFLTGFDCNFLPINVSVLKIIAKPVSKLPNWHPGKGDKGWFFVDEVFLN